MTKQQLDNFLAFVDEVGLENVGAVMIDAVLDGSKGSLLVGDWAEGKRGYIVENKIQNFPNGVRLYDTAFRSPFNDTDD